MNALSMEPQIDDRPRARAARRYFGADERRLQVHPDDEMLGFLATLRGGDPDQAWCDYMQQGSAIAALLLRILRWRFGADLAARRVLDFASGYGRVTRFLLAEVPPQRLTISDVLPGAVAFQQRAFGVTAVASASRPEDLALDGSFDAILVTSLFTHLPEHRFAAWLGALCGRLAPGGVLVFTTHDPALLPAAERGDGGFCFRPESEIAALSLADYGSTWVDEPFVRRTLAAVAPTLAARRFPRAVCNYQDLWVAIDGDAAALATLVPRSEPECTLDVLAIGPGALDLAGWCSGRHCRPEAVEVEVDGELAARLALGIARPDVAASRDVDERCGFAGPVPLRAETALDSILALFVVDERGERWLCWVGSLHAAARMVREAELHRLRGRAEHAELGLAQAQARVAPLETRVAALEARLAAMRSSRFWKLRDAWFACKRALGITSEE